MTLELSRACCSSVIHSFSSTWPLYIADSDWLLFVVSSLFPSLVYHFKVFVAEADKLIHLITNYKQVEINLLTTQLNKRRKSETFNSFFLVSVLT